MNREKSAAMTTENLEPDEETMLCVRCGRPVNESGFRLEVVEGCDVRVRAKTGSHERNLWRVHTRVGYYCSVECLARTQAAALAMLSAALPGPAIRVSDPEPPAYEGGDEPGSDMY